MTQHLNLLKVEQRRLGVTELSFGLLGLFITGLIALGGYQQYGLMQQKTNLEKQLAMVEQSRVLFQEKRRQAGMEDFDSLGPKVAELRQRLAANKDISDLIEKGELGVKPGPSEIFLSLASVSERGVWIRTIDIDRSGKSLVLTGGAVNAEAVMRYASRLNTVFKSQQIEFSTIDISDEELTSPNAGVRPVTIVRFRLN